MFDFIRKLFSKEKPGYGRARGLVVHRVPTRWLDQETPDPDSYVEVFREEVDNLITNAGRDVMHTFGYVTTGADQEVFQYVALSNTTLTETVTSTTLNGEIAANGLQRAQGTPAHTTGTNTSTITKTFTCGTAPQAAQKAALFDDTVNGDMNHVLAFTQRSLQIGDQLQITFTITVG
jgi:hypothetical protein